MPANEAKSRYITSISHELRTPLNSILGYAQILDEDASHAGPPAARPIKVIRRGGEHLLSLIEGTPGPRAHRRPASFKLEPQADGRSAIAMDEIWRACSSPQAAAKGHGLPNTSTDRRRVAR